jgi:SAM-dependent methyltransferase
MTATDFVLSRDTRNQMVETPAGFETLHACPLCGADRISMLDASASICECQSCGYVFDNPRPTIEGLVAFYSQPTKYDSWLSEEEPRDVLWKRRLKLLLPFRKPGSLLDVGAGIGQFLEIARPYFTEVCGTEVSESAIDIAHRKYGLGLMRGEIQSLDFGATRFDNITLFHVLEHVPDPKSVIEKCALLLKDDGILAIAVPNDLNSAKLKVKRLLGSIGVRKFRKLGKSGLQRLVLDGSIPEIHLSHFRPEVLRRLVERCGFSVIRDSLDPYYVSRGSAKWKHAGFYNSCKVLRTILGINVYDTILLVARRYRR